MNLVVEYKHDKNPPIISFIERRINDEIGKFTDRIIDKMDLTTIKRYYHHPKMSIYVVNHKDKFYLYYLKDMYHHTLLHFWEENRNLDTINIPDDLKKGILHNEVLDISAFDTIYNVLTRYQSKVCVHSESLWWYLNTETMTIRRIPQD